MEVVTDAPDGEPDVLKGVHDQVIKVDHLLGDIKVDHHPRRHQVDHPPAARARRRGCDRRHSHLVEPASLVSPWTLWAGSVYPASHADFLTGAPYLEFLVLISILLSQAARPAGSGELRCCRPSSCIR